MPTKRKHTVAGETAADFAESGLDESAAFNEIFRALQRRGFGACAECLAELWFADDIDEDQEPLSLESARGFVKFMRDFPDLGEPMLGLFLGGTLSAEWRIADNKHLLVEVLGGEKTAFALINASGRPGEKLCANGNGTITEVAHALRKRGIDKWRDA